jgi:Transposase IS66 family
MTGSWMRTGGLRGERDLPKARVKELDGRVEELRRASKRQAAPFSRGEPSAVGLSRQKTPNALARFGIQITPSAVVQAIAHQARRLEPTYEALTERVRSSHAVAPDETGGQKAWLWAFAGEGVTVYLIAWGRGYEHAAQILGDDYSGCWSATGGRPPASSPPPATKPAISTCSWRPASRSVTRSLQDRLLRARRRERDRDPRHHRPRLHRRHRQARRKRHDARLRDRCGTAPLLKRTARLIADDEQLAS